MDSPGKILSRLSALREIGVPPGLAPEEAKYIRLTNMGAFGLLLLMASAVPPAFRFHLPVNLLVIGTAFALVLLVFVFNHARRYTLARVHILAVFNLYQLVMCVFSTEKIIDHYAFFFSAAGAIVIFSRKETRWMIAMLVMSVVCYHAVLALYRLFPEPLYPVSEERVRFVNTALVYSFYIAVIFTALIGRSGANHAEDRLKAEQERSERLLLNVLPKPIADRLKDDSEIIADNFPEATVLFSDLVGFTKMSAGLPPERLVQLLNEIFSAFDDLARQHGLEKIKTIGDGYMAAAGVPRPRPDHAEAAAEMALSMVAFLEHFNRGRESPLGIRIGLHTGPVVAGVIGKSKFSYDLWGDAVNTASRMESHGLDNRIQVSQPTYERLQDRFCLVERGPLEVKGKGRMNTWFLTGKK